MLVGAAVGLQQRVATAGELVERLRRRRQLAGVDAIDRKTLFGDLRGRQQQVLQRQLAILRHGEIVRGQRAGDGDRQRPRLAQLRDGLAVAKEHVARRRGGGFLAAVDGDQRAVGAADENKAAAAEARVVVVDDAERHRRGDGGVDRVAARLERGDARLGRQRLHRGDHADGRLLRGGAALAALLLFGGVAVCEQPTSRTRAQGRSEGATWLRISS